MFNLEYRILDKLGRTKRTKYGGLFRDEVKLEEFKQKVLEEEKGKKVAFDVYILNDSLFKAKSC